MDRDLSCAICGWPLEAQPNGTDLQNPESGPPKAVLLVSLCEECYQVAARLNHTGKFGPPWVPSS